jgi:hypothetical protein
VLYRARSAGLAKQLGETAAARPQDQVLLLPFVVSQWGSPTTYWKALRPAQRQQFGGIGPCSFLDPRGQLVPKELARLETIIHGYEAQLAAGCQRIPRCTYGGGAFGRQVDKNQQITEDSTTCRYDTNTLSKCAPQRSWQAVLVRDLG